MRYYEIISRNDCQIIDGLHTSIPTPKKQSSVQKGRCRIDGRSPHVAEKASDL